MTCRWSLALVAAWLPAIACAAPDPDPRWMKQVAAALEKAGTYETVEPVEKVSTSEPEEEARRDGSVWECVTETHEVIDAAQDYATFQPNAEVIYPGSALQGATLVVATPEPRAKRTGISVATPQPRERRAGA